MKRISFRVAVPLVVVAAGCIVLTLSSCWRSRGDVYLRDMLGKPSLQLRDGKVWIRMTGDVAVSAAWEVPHCRIEGTNVLFFAHRSLNEHPRVFDLSLSCSESEIHDLSFLWLDPDGVVHPLVLSGYSENLKGNSRLE